jgi:2-polyprenyl-3-methyl-5-hydroxy-6-metoxy-1,4-benzoquinol methylase
VSKEFAPGDFPALNAEAMGAWEAVADWWDQATAEADDFHRQVVIPATDRLLAVRPGERVLDVACGNGGYARHLAAQGAEIVAVDASPRLMELARRRTAGDRISYRHVDATDGAALRALGPGSFDAAVCKMALMDMAEIQPLAGALAELLRPGGRFVFAVLHPAFNSTGTSLLAEQLTTETGELVVQRAVKVMRYLEPEALRGVAKRDQPVPHRYFHRPLAVLFGVFFGAGFVLDGLEEPRFTPAAAGTKESAWIPSPDVPPVLVARLRLPGGEGLGLGSLPER